SIRRCRRARCRPRGAPWAHGASPRWPSTAIRPPPRASTSTSRFSPSSLDEVLAADLPAVAHQRRRLVPGHAVAQAEPLGADARLERLAPLGVVEPESGGAVSEPDRLPRQIPVETALARLAPGKLHRRLDAVPAGLVRRRPAA